MKLAYISVPTWSISMTTIKTGICLTILRIQSTRRWKFFLYTIIVVQITYCVGNTLFAVFRCRPFWPYWSNPADNPRGGQQYTCLGPDYVTVATVLGSTINIATDVLLALTPFFFLRTLRRPRREKALVCLLMAFGLFASFASLMKAIVVGMISRDTDDAVEDDKLAMGVSISTWMIAEQGLAVFAACAPCLKGFVESLLVRCGFSLGLCHGDNCQCMGSGSRPTRRWKHNSGGSRDSEASIWRGRRGRTTTRDIRRIQDVESRSESSLTAIADAHSNVRFPPSIYGSSANVTDAEDNMKLEVNSEGRIVMVQDRSSTCESPKASFSAEEGNLGSAPERAFLR
jgi:hypothetical protein